MISKRKIYLPLIVVFSIITLMNTQGCEKDYSYERQTASDTTIIGIGDTSKIDATRLPACQLCDNNQSLPISKWSFKNNDIFACGSVDIAFLDYDKKDVIFFGPSACSADTGLSIAGNFDPIVFDSDKFNISTKNVVLYYYDYSRPDDVFISLPPSDFTMTVDSFINQTGMVTGRFSGYVFTNKGDKTFISSGKFRLKVH